MRINSYSRQGPNSWQGIATLPCTVQVSCCTGHQADYLRYEIKYQPANRILGLHLRAKAARLPLSHRLMQRTHRMLPQRPTDESVTGLVQQLHFYAGCLLSAWLVGPERVMASSEATARLATTQLG